MCRMTPNRELHVAGLLLLLVAAAVGAGVPACDKAKMPPEVNQLFEDFWTWRLSRTPEFSSMIGDQSHDTELETFTSTRYAEDFDSCQIFLDRATNLLATVEDPEANKLLRFFVAEVKTFTDGYTSMGFHFPMNYMEGVQVDFERIFLEFISLKTVEDYDNVIKRYNKFLKQAEDLVGTMREALAQGRANHNVSMDGVVTQCRNHLVSPQETVFYKVFEKAENISNEDLDRLKAEASKAIEASIQPGFKMLADFIENEYMAKTRPDIAASSLSPEFYKACLAFHTSTNLTAEEIHQKGLGEVDRIEEEMKAIIAEMGLDLTIPEFIEMIRNDKNNYYDSPEKLLAAFKDILDQRVDPVLLNFFHAKPASELEIVEVPASTPDAPAAYYLAGTMDGSRPGRFYVNTHKYDSQPKYEMVTLSLHEANPGHHLQGSYSLAQENWPAFRKVMEDRAYSLAPTRFPINTAYTEGWALYTESLGFEMGLYDDPLDRFGHLSEEIFRACRLVVDTGMHALGWTREMAVDFMAAHTAASLENIRGEVNRYVTWPGQATGYKIGQLKIKELRQLAEQELGDQFNIKDFHEVVLQSVGPLFLLEEEVMKYIEMNKK